MATELPFLPGYSFAAPKNSYAKSHKFDKQNGIMMIDADDLRKNGKLTTHYDPATSFRVENKWNLEEDSKAQSLLRTENGKKPAWITYDKKVLRFFGFFKEPVHCSPIENFRVRKCVIYYYLEDNTVYVGEPKVENSGIPQGAFVKRHRIPKGDEGFISEADLYIGAELAIYGRVFRLVDCDEYTRTFYKDTKGVAQPAAESYPSDPFTELNNKPTTTFHKLMSAQKTFVEATLGRAMGISVADTTKFLKNDGKVLRFFCTWDDTSTYGEKRPYVLHYFLADDTMEVQEIQQPNSGRDPFPALLKRGKVPKDFTQSVASVATIGHRDAKSVQYYKDSDLRVGSSVTVYGRELLLCACDGFTQDYYMKTYGLKAQDFNKLDMKEAEEPSRPVEVPPYNGFGTEEDSMQSCLHLVPRAPKKDFNKWLENDGCNLRFLARLANPAIEDAERRFVITYYMADDTVSVFEKFERNSGFVGGKFLERSRSKNAATGEFFKPQEFFVGAALLLNKFNFQLLSADEYSYKYMEANPEKFPAADAKAVMQKMRRDGLQGAPAQNLAARLQAADAASSGKIDAQSFKDLLLSTGVQLSEHQQFTLLRKYDTQKDGQIDYSAFSAALLQ